MKIIHYLFGLPPVRTGGLPRYALNLINEQKRMGHEVGILIPGPIKSNTPESVKICKWRKQNVIPCYRIINPIYIPNAYGIKQPRAFMPKVSIEIYKKWLLHVQPDVLHVHSLLGLHREFFQAANQLHIPIIFTTHDYFGLCPKIDYLKNNKNCETKDWGECIDCCKKAYGLRRLKLEQSDVYRKYCGSKYLMNMVHGKTVAAIKKGLGTVQHKQPEDSVTEYADKGKMETTISCDKEFLDEYRNLQRYYVDIFNRIDYYHFNSRQTKTVYERILGEKPGKVIPVMNNSIHDERREKEFAETLRIGYLGTQMPMKGYGYLLQELDKVYESGRYNFCLHTYMLESETERPYIENHKPFTSRQQEKVYEAMDVLVVPSIWRETFGMVVLEALSYGVPVLVSEYVGAKMLIEEHTGCGRIFRIEEGELAGIIKEIYDDRTKLIQINRKILKSSIGFEYIKHVEEICKIYGISK